MTSITRRLSGEGSGSPMWSRASVGEWLRSPVAPYYLVLSAATILTGLGLVMVLSASSVGSYAKDGNSYLIFLDQLMYAGIGVALAFVGSRIPLAWWKRLAWPGIIAALLLQAAVFTPLGLDAYQGNRNWLSIGGRTLQPSELGKVALVVFGAMALATKRRLMHRIGHATIPFIFPLGIVLLGLVLQGHDLGTGMILLAIMVGMLWSAGLPARWFVGVGAVAGIGLAFLAAGSANRMQRIQVWLGDICSNPHVDGCFQKVHAEYALADGGWWGLGLGQSREKWGLLPEPHNDFILAIIGEELGLPGTIAVLVLFAILGYACFRIVSQSEDPFTRLATSGVMIWFLVQALLNIGSVIGMLPIIGVPLPLVSSGGSALVAALIAVGLLLALARSVPGAAQALGGRPATLRRTLMAVPTSGPTRSSRGKTAAGGGKPGRATTSHGSGPTRRAGGAGRAPGVGRGGRAVGTGRAAGRSAGTARAPRGHGRRR